MAEKMKSAEAAAPLIDNGDVKKLLSLLSKVEGDRAKEFSQLIAYVDAMGRQFDRVSAELVQVRGQLAELQQSPVKKALSAAVTGLEKGVHAARERLAAVKEQIAEGAARAVEEVKHAGLAGLNKAVSFLGVKKTLNLLRGDLHNTVTDAKATIAKVEAVGEELRSVGGHRTPCLVDGGASAPMIRAGRSRQTGPPAWRPRRNRDGCASPPATR